MNKRTIILTTILTLVGVVVFAMPGPGGGPPGPPGGGGPPCWQPPCIPIDGGIGLLMAMGVAFGAKKLYSGLK